MGKAKTEVIQTDKQKRSSMKGERGRSGYSKDRTTLFTELNDYQKRLKADANSQKIYQVQVWECKELLVELH